MNGKPRGAVVVGGYVNGLGLIRALSARGVPTAVIVTHPYDVAHRSRWVSGHEVAFDLDERPERLLEVLERRAAEWSGWALIPANDDALSAVARLHEELSARHVVVAPPWEIARRLLDKGAMLDLARAAGVDLPHAYGPAEPATAELPELRFPVVVKPLLSHRFQRRFGTKLFVADDRGELRRAIADFHEARLVGEVFDLIPGGDDRIYVHCTYLDAHGDPVGSLTVRKIRQSPPLFGVARVAEVVADEPALREITLELLRRIGFRGMASAEFKLDPRDGRFRLLEINGRSVIFNGLLRRAGLDVAGLAWSDYVLGRCEAARPHGWNGVWINLHADVLHSLFSRNPTLEVTEFLRPYLRPVTYAVWSARDPGPFALQWRRSARAAAGFAMPGANRTLLADHSRR